MKRKNVRILIFMAMIALIGVSLYGEISRRDEYPNQVSEEPRVDSDFKFFIQVSGNYMLSAEERFRDVYGSGFFYPEITAGWKFTRNFYLWGGYGFFSKKGQSVVLGEPSTWRQHNLSLGIGYYQDLSIPLAWQLKIGAVWVNYSEEAFIEKVDADTIGVNAAISGIYKIGDYFYIGLSFGYLYASDTVGNITVKPGGFSSGVIIGLRL